MKVDVLVKQLKGFQSLLGNVEVDIHVITNNPTLSKASIKGVINESSLQRPGGKAIVRKIVIFGGGQYG